MDIFLPIKLLADIATYFWLGLEEDSYLGNAINFFIYDVIKIGILLVTINFVMAAVRYYFPIEKMRKVLSSRRWYGLDYFIAALLGVITPFCSCSSIPLFIGFVRSGIPLGVTFTFLISSPLINESSLYIFPSIFGFKVSILYNLVGISIAMLGGAFIQKLNVEKYVKPEFLKFKSPREIVEKVGEPSQSMWHLANFFYKDGMNITKQVFPYVVLGVAIGALIHGYVPQSIVEQYLSAREWWSVPIATLLGAPLYANSVSVIPVMEAMVGKGVPLGTALAFMTSTVAVSVPEALILKKVLYWQLLAIFFGITILGIMIIGFLFNVIL